MAKLLNKTRGEELAHDVRAATNLFSRMKGLLGETRLEPGKTLWIHRCNSIHTWFMRFPIDVIFVDRRLVVKATIKNLKPWRLPLPVFSASSVFELPAGTLTDRTVARGDQLHVGD